MAASTISLSRGSVMARPSKTEIRGSLATKDITGAGAELLVKKFDQAYAKVEAKGGIDVVRQSVIDRVEAARIRLGMSVDV